MPRHLTHESPFPYDLPGYSVYGTDTDLLGQEVSLALRRKLWENLTVQEALTLIAQLVVDIETETDRVENPVSLVEQRWLAKVQLQWLKDKLLIASTFKVRIFSPQILLLAAKEAILYCPETVENQVANRLDLIIFCLLGIGRESQATTPGNETGQWGKLDSSLASELIANIHFNQRLWVSHQLVWFERTWYGGWPESSALVERVAGDPESLFEEATGVNLADFSAIACSLWSQASEHKYVLFPTEFFDFLGLPRDAVERSLERISCSISDMRNKIISEQKSGNSNRFSFDDFNRFPLIRLTSGYYILLSPKFLLRRAVSETTFWDVRNYLNDTDSRRANAFHLCTTKILEDQTGSALRRVFKKKSSKVVDEAFLQRVFGTKKSTPSVCDYAVKVGRFWLLFEVTDRAMVRPVVSANASVEELDEELGRVLTDKKAGQLRSTIDILKSREKGELGEGGAEEVFIPLVVTGSNGLPWILPVSHRAQEMLARMGYSKEFCESVAIITLKDLSMLENAANEGHDVVSILASWRQLGPNEPLDLHFVRLGIRINSPRWERNSLHSVVNRMTRRMKPEGSK